MAASGTVLHLGYIYAAFAVSSALCFGARIVQIARKFSCRQMTATRAGHVRMPPSLGACAGVARASAAKSDNTVMERMLKWHLNTKKAQPVVFNASPSIDWRFLNLRLLTVLLHVIGFNDD